LPSARDLETLAAALRRASRDQAVDVAARALSAGATPDDVLGAVFLAGVLDIQPRPVGNVLHSVMMVESIFRLVAGAPADEARLAALWAVDDFALGKERDDRRMAWELGPPPVVHLDATEARRELVAGLEQYDPERAERGVVALLAHAGAGVAMDAIWPFAARSFRDAGHRIIYAAQVDRSVRRLDACVTQPALRSLVIGLASDAEGPHTAAYASSQELVRRLSEAGSRDAGTPDASFDVLRALRGGTPEACQRAVVDALQDALGSQVVWDGLRLYASELFWLRPGRRHVFPVHTLTEMEAFGYAASRVGDTRTERLLMLQAAAWAALARDAIVRNDGAYATGPGIDAEVVESDAGTEGSVANDLGSHEPARVQAALEAHPAVAAEYVARVRAEFIPRADQNHQYKLAGAVLDEADRVHPRWRARVLAGMADYLPSASDPVTDVHRRSQRALRDVGLL